MPSQKCWYCHQEEDEGHDPACPKGIHEKGMIAIHSQIHTLEGFAELEKPELWAALLEEFEHNAVQYEAGYLAGATNEPEPLSNHPSYLLGYRIGPKHQRAKIA